MRYLLNESTDPHFNMSLDEWCLKNLPSGETFFWLWRNAPSVIIGENQNAASEVNLEYIRAHGIKLARRSTGGGAVYHDLQNLNYSIVGRSASPQSVVDALRSLGVPAELTGRNDIFVDGRKVSGYARRLEKDNVLVHGTLMYDVDIDTLTRALDVPGSKLNVKGVASVHSRVANLKDYLPFAAIEEFRDVLLGILSDGDGEYVLSKENMLEIEALKEKKYANPDWIYSLARDL